ncbi:MAG: family 20 glycosylhydrolase [Planctomycetota bacterium]
MATGLLRLPPENPATAWLNQAYPRAFSATRGTPVKLFVQDRSGFEIQCGRSGGVAFSCASQADFLAACGEWLSAPGLDNETAAPFDFRAVMIDCSRNGVLTVEHFKKILPQLAMLGLNAACLYTEDTYDVQGHPLIGYQRGKYSAAEIRDLDAWARRFGIELFPCIQTLGHLAHLLKYSQYQHLRDDGSVLNVLKPETYKLLETMIRSAVAPYQSKRIHIGMDETHGLGLGQTFDPVKRRDPRAMYVAHVAKIAALCKKLKLEPIMWGDIVIGMTGTQAMDKSQTAKLPRKVEMNYWDYYREDPNIYDTRIKQYRQMGFEPLISPGVWNWNRFWPAFDKMEMSCVPFMEIAKQRGVRRAMITMWGDDGQECPFDANLPALALYLEHCMSAKVDLRSVKARLKAVTGASFDDLVLPQKLDQYPGVKKAAVVPMNLGKALIWDDPLLSRVGAQAGKRRLAAHYSGLERQIAAAAKRASAQFQPLLEFARRTADFLALKADLHIRARQAYAAGNKRELGVIARDAVRAFHRLAALCDQHRANWMAERKPFGWERLDLRYGGQLARLESFNRTLKAYVSGRQKTIPELAEPVQKVFAQYPLIDRVLGYDTVATPSTSFV